MLLICLTSAESASQNYFVEHSFPSDWAVFLSGQASFSGIRVKVSLRQELQSMMHKSTSRELHLHARQPLWIPRSNERSRSEAVSVDDRRPNLQLGVSRSSSKKNKETLQKNKQAACQASIFLPQNILLRIVSMLLSKDFLFKWWKRHSISFCKCDAD